MKKKKKKTSFSFVFVVFRGERFENWKKKKSFYIVRRVIGCQRRRVEGRGGEGRGREGRGEDSKMILL